MPARSLISILNSPLVLCCKGGNGKGDSVLNEGDTLEADNYRVVGNNRFLREITNPLPK
jgi:hypothetical protein